MVKLYAYIYFFFQVNINFSVGNLTKKHLTEAKSSKEYNINVLPGQTNGQTRSD